MRGYCDGEYTSDGAFRLHHEPPPTQHWLITLRNWVITLMFIGVIVGLVVIGQRRDDKSTAAFYKKEETKFSKFCNTLNAHPVFRSDAWLCVENGTVKYKMEQVPTP